MSSILGIVFGFPSILLIAVLAFVGVYDTMQNVWSALQIEDYAYLYGLSAVTIVAGIVGWILGGLV